MIKYNLYLLLIFSIAACSPFPKKYLSEATVFKMAEEKYDSLRGALKDSLALGIKNVNDYNHSFTEDEKVRLDSLINDFKKQTGLRLIIFTLDSLMTSKDSVFDVTQIVGIKNHINITVAIPFPYRTMSIWNDSLVNNTVLNAYDTKYIIENSFVPLFKRQEYFTGTFEGTRAIMQHINNNIKDRNFTKEAVRKAVSK